MTANAESPTTEPITDTVTGGATLARTWYGQVRSAFGKPHIALMSDVQDPATINHSSQPISSLIGTIPSLRFTTPARLRELADVAQRERVDAGEAIIPAGEYGDDVFFILDGTFDVLISHFGHTPISSVYCAPATRSASSACSTSRASFRKGITAAGR